MIIILPVSLFAQESGTAVLRSSDGTHLNKNVAPATSALFSDDLIETQRGATARIEAPGSTADVDSETVVQFEGDELVLDHGSLSVNTSRSLRVRVGCLTVTPVHADWTHYTVVDVNGKVTVAAMKDDVYIDARARKEKPSEDSVHSDRVTVRESEQKSREEKCGAADVKDSTPWHAHGPFLNSAIARGIGIGVVGGMICFALCRSDPEPMSPSKP
jgi:hypothetical protein